jgi:hypothetical protein
MLYFARFDGTTDIGMAIVSANSEEEAKEKINRKYHKTQCHCMIEIHTITPLNQLLFEEQDVALILLSPQMFAV